MQANRVGVVSPRRSAADQTRVDGVHGVTAVLQVRCSARRSWGRTRRVCRAKQRPRPHREARVARGSLHRAVVPGLASQAARHGNAQLGLGSTAVRELAIVYVEDGVESGGVVQRKVGLRAPATSQRATHVLVHLLGVCRRNGSSSVKRGRLAGSSRRIS